jgi:FxsC-like protein
MSAERMGAADGGPHFFLSYTHTQKYGRREDPPDKPVQDFYRDLSEEVANLAGLPRTRSTGFADWEIRTGDPWEQELERMLSICGSFVALYSPAYFESDICGQEWAAFRTRESRHKAHARRDKSAIIPVMWQRVDDEHMPPAASRIHYRLPQAGETYHRRGMRELVMRRNREEIDQAYRRAVAACAARIVDVTSNDRLPSIEGGTLRLNPDENAFAGQWSRNDPRPLRFVIVAPVKGRLPAGAVLEMYGKSPEQWRPYLPDDSTPIAETAVALGHFHGFRPMTESLESCPDLRNGAAPTAPTILIVDPWAAKDPELDALLRTFDEISHEKPWVQLMIPWDKERSGDGSRVDELERGLRQVLYRTRARCRMRNPEAVNGLASAAAFGERLLGVVALAEKGYFHKIAALAPPGGGSTLPRLGGPGFRA